MKQDKLSVVLLPFYFLFFSFLLAHHPRHIRGLNGWRNDSFCFPWPSLVRIHHKSSNREETFIFRLSYPSTLFSFDFLFVFSSSFLLRTNARQRPVPIFLTNWWKVMKTKKILTHQSFQVNRKEKKKRYIHHIALFTDVMDDADKDTRRRVLTGSTSYRCIYIYIYLLFIYDLFLNKMH